MERFAIKLNAKSKAKIYKICRLCGMDNPEKLPIIDETIEQLDGDPDLGKKILDCVGIHVLKTDKMPQFVCTLCSDKINDFYEFREMCMATNIQTRKLLGLADIKPTIKQMKGKRKLPPIPEKKLDEEILSDTKDFKDDIILTTAKKKQKLNNDPPKAVPVVPKVRINTKLNKINSKLNSNPKLNLKLNFKLNQKLPPTFIPKLNIKPIEWTQPVVTDKLPTKRAAKQPGNETPPIVPDKSQPKRDRSMKQVAWDIPVVTDKPSSKRDKSVKLPAWDTPLLTEKAPNKRELMLEKEMEKSQKKRKVKGPVIQPIQPIVPVVPVKSEKTEKSDKTSKETPAINQSFCIICNLHHDSTVFTEHFQKVHLPDITEFGCHSCCETFPDATASKTHHMWHRLSKTSYQCSYCMTTFRNSSQLERHFIQCISRTFDTNSYQPDIKCELCSNIFLTKNLYNWHDCFVRKNGRCYKCKRSFVKKYTLFRHIVLCDHPEPEPEPEEEKPIEAKVTKKKKGKRKEGKPKPESTELIKAEPETMLECDGDLADKEDPTDDPPEDTSSSSFMQMDHHGDDDTDMDENVENSDNEDNVDNVCGNEIGEGTSISESNVEDVEVPVDNVTNKRPVEVEKEPMVSISIKTEPLDRAVVRLEPIVSIPKRQQPVTVKNTAKQPEPSVPERAPEISEVYGGVRIKKEKLHAGYGDYDPNVARNIKPEPGTEPVIQKQKPISLKLKIRKEKGTLNASIVAPDPEPEPEAEPIVERTIDTAPLARETSIDGGGKSSHRSEKRKDKSKKHRDPSKQIFKIPALLAMKIKQEKVDRGYERYETNATSNHTPSTVRHNKTVSRDRTTVPIIANVSAGVTIPADPQDTIKLPVISNVVAAVTDLNTLPMIRIKEEPKSPDRRAERINSTISNQTNGNQSSETIPSTNRLENCDRISNDALSTVGNLKLNEIDSSVEQNNVPNDKEYNCVEDATNLRLGTLLPTISFGETDENYVKPADSKETHYSPYDSSEETLLEMPEKNTEQISPEDEETLLELPDKNPEHISPDDDETLLELPEKVADEITPEDEDTLLELPVKNPEQLSPDDDETLLEMPENEGTPPEVSEDRNSKGNDEPAQCSSNEIRLNNLEETSPDESPAKENVSNEEQTVVRNFAGISVETIEPKPSSEPIDGNHQPTNPSDLLDDISDDDFCLESDDDQPPTTENYETTNIPSKSVGTDQQPTGQTSILLGSISNIYGADSHLQTDEDLLNDLLDLNSNDDQISSQIEYSEEDLLNELPPSGDGEMNVNPPIINQINQQTAQSSVIDFTTDYS